ncbi:fragile X mental retardation 1 neighbor protein isoform X2 [Mesocricetus auratus]|uniref:Fragile X mental retardation 1 neighbor protein isoform X2 n=1 Tax=Mesocricetus auratus TaxID=10036 RepID=A0ABM2XAM7_MESAU|nr:fragile X mental retardation 1 neighbor protein isoform X2 [Mesocricetus auratus]
MPSELRLRQGRKRFKNRGARLKMAVVDSGYRGENLSLGMYHEAWSFGQGINMVASPRFGFWSAVRQRLQRMCSWRLLGLFLLFLWALVILCYLANSDSFSPRQKLPRYNAALHHGSEWEFLANFFFPTTCIIRGNQKVVPCNKQPNLSKTECLKSKCCFSSSGTKVKCYAPLRDKPTQMLRAFGLSLISMVFLGFLPMYCCLLCRRSISF